MTSSVADPCRRAERFKETAMGRAMPNPTIPDDATELDRCAFNAAFYELGLRWAWDSDTYRALLGKANERERVREYIEGEQPHLLRAYNADFLAEAVVGVKQRCRQSLSGCEARGLPQFNWADERWGEVGV
jgi:hypothetical protein